jgi:hypothetical protein
MNIRKGYQLNVDTIESIEDVKAIFNGLNLTTYPEGDDWPILQKYFTIEIDIPQVLTEEEMLHELKLADQELTVEKYFNDI